ESLEGRINSGRTAAVTAGLVQMRGGVPVLVGGRVVGAVGVSGVDNNNDVQVAGAAAAAVK
ncbi:MAG: heme-binding protein, partial [Janthinobacterium lividum]